jgi:signal transduction histidine kinase
MPGGGVLRLEARRVDGGRAVEASVADTGEGLAPDLVAHLFEPFYTTKPEGTGLGLAIAREIALAHRGELHAENRPGGRGAVFRLVLPIAKPGAQGVGHDDDL